MKDKKKRESTGEQREDENVKEGFADEKSKPKVKFVMYYVPWCPHCRTAKPEWKKLKEYSEQLPWADVQSVDCEENPSEAENNNIQYFPTMLVFKGGESGREYEGPRSFANMKEFLNNQIEKK